MPIPAARHHRIQRPAWFPRRAGQPPLYAFVVGGEDHRRFPAYRDGYRHRSPRIGEAVVPLDGMTEGGGYSSTPTLINRIACTALQRCPSGSYRTYRILASTMANARRSNTNRLGERRAVVILLESGFDRLSRPTCSQVGNRAPGAPPLVEEFAKAIKGVRLGAGLRDRDLRSWHRGILGVVCVATHDLPRVALPHQLHHAARNTLSPARGSAVKFRSDFTSVSDLRPSVIESRTSLRTLGGMAPSIAFALLAPFRMR